MRRQVSLHAYLHRALRGWRLLVIRAGDEGDVGRHLVVGELALAGKEHQAELCGHSVGHHETVCLWTVSDIMKQSVDTVSDIMKQCLRTVSDIMKQPVDTV